MSFSYLALLESQEKYLKVGSCQDPESSELPDPSVRYIVVSALVLLNIILYQFYFIFYPFLTLCLSVSHLLVSSSYYCTKMANIVMNVGL